MLVFPARELQPEMGAKISSLDKYPIQQMLDHLKEKIELAGPLCDSYHVPGYVLEYNTSLWLDTSVAEKCNKGVEKVSACKYPKAEDARMGNYEPNSLNSQPKPMGQFSFKNRTSPDQFHTQFCSVLIDYSQTVFIEQFFHSWKDGTLVLSPHLWWSSNSHPEVWAVFIRLKLSPCIRKPPANNLDFRGTGEIYSCGQIFFILIRLMLSAKLSYQHAVLPSDRCFTQQMCVRKPQDGWGGCLGSCKKEYNINLSEPHNSLEKKVEL